MPYLSGGQAEMFIGALRRPIEQFKRDQRAMLARNDETVEIFRQNKVQLRMQLLTGTLQERRRILRAAFVVCCPHHLTCRPSQYVVLVIAMCKSAP